MPTLQETIQQAGGWNPYGGTQNPTTSPVSSSPTPTLTRPFDGLHSLGAPTPPRPIPPELPPGGQMPGMFLPPPFPLPAVQALGDWITKARFPDPILTPDLVNQGLANPALALQFAQERPDIARRFLDANPELAQLLAAQHPTEARQIQNLLYPSIPSVAPPPQQPPFYPPELPPAVPPEPPPGGQTPGGGPGVYSLGAPQPIPMPSAPPPTFTLNQPTNPAASPAFLDIIKQYMGNVQKQGTNELDRQIQENFLPALKTAAVASGQISDTGAASGPYYENLARLSADAGRTAGNIVLGAQTTGLGKTMEQMQFQAQQEMRSIELDLQRQIAQGTISVQQAQLTMETARTNMDAQLKQQQLQLAMLDLLSGRQLQQSELGIKSIQGAQTLRLQELLALAGLGGADANAIIAAIGAMRQGGGTTTSNTSGDLLGDMLNIGTLAVAAAGLSSKTLKDDIHPLSVDEEAQIVTDILTIPVQRWRYKWDAPMVERIGPIAEDLPESMREGPLMINMHTIISGLVVTIQQLEARLARVENRKE